MKKIVSLLCATLLVFSASAAPKAQKAELVKKAPAAVELNQLAATPASKVFNLKGQTPVRTIAPAKAPAVVTGDNEVVNAYGIITQPAEGERKEYNRLETNTAFYYQNNISLTYQSGTATMVECADGTVYWKDPISTYANGTWIKGKKEGSTISFAAKQPILYNSQYNTTLSVRWGYFESKISVADDYANSFIFDIKEDTLIMRGTQATVGSTPTYFPGIFWDDDNSFQGYGDCGVTLYKKQPILERDTVDIVSTGLQYNDGYLVSNKLVIFYAADVPGYSVFRVTSNNTTTVDGTFKWADGTINDPNSYFQVSGSETKNYFQDGEFTVVIDGKNSALIGWMIGTDEKYYRLNMSYTAPTTRDTVRFSGKGVTISEVTDKQTGVQTGWFYELADASTGYEFLLQSTVVANKYGTFSYEDKTLGNNYWNLFAPDGSKQQFKEGLITVGEVGDNIVLDGELIAQDEKVYILHFTQNAAVLNYDTDAPFVYDFDWRILNPTVEKGVACIYVNDGEKAISLELYCDPTATEIPAGTYTLSDTKKEGSALKSVGVIDGRLQPCWAGTVAASGGINDAWFFVEGAVTLSYDDYGKLAVEVNAKNSYDQDIKVNIKYEKLNAKDTVMVDNAEFYIYEGYMEDYGFVIFYGDNDDVAFDLYAYGDTLYGNFTENIDLFNCLLKTEVKEFGVLDANLLEVTAEGKNLTLKAEVLGADTVLYVINATGYYGSLYYDNNKGYEGKFEEVAVKQDVISNERYLFFQGMNEAGDSLALAIKGELIESTITAGEYTEVLASTGLYSDSSPVPSFVMGADEAKWFIQNGKLTVNENGTMLFEGVNSFDKNVTIAIANVRFVNNIITYTATEKLPEVTEEFSDGLHINAFNVAITSHEFANGIGTITFADDVTTIGYQAFYRCFDLTSIIIPNSVTTIGNDAFADCAGLTSVTIPNSVKTIGDNAFDFVNNVVYNGTATGVPWGAKCVNGYVDGYLVYSDASKTTLCGCFSVATGKVIIPNSVTTIGDRAFAFCTDLTSIEIPNSVTRIGKMAFFSCHHLTPIEIPNSITTIEYETFAYCTDFTSITIPSSVTTIGNNAFIGCDDLTSISIPNSVTTIGDLAFTYCYGLTSIEIPNSVTRIGKMAFYECYRLIDVNVAWTSSDQLPTMGDGVFNNIANGDGSSAATLHIPEGTKSIYEAADQWKDFGTIIEELPTPKNNVITYTATEKLLETTDYSWDGSGLHTDAFNVAITSHEFSNGIGTITFADDVTTIGHYAFANCYEMISITIPKSVTTIGNEAFVGCSKLTSIYVDASNTHYRSVDGVLFNYPKDTLIQYPIGNTRTEYTIPNSVTTIEWGTFRYCDNLTSVTIPNSVTTIGRLAFGNCDNLTSVAIGNSVTTIGLGAFEFCKGLTSITIPNSVTTIGEVAFEYCESMTSVMIGNSVTTIGEGAFEFCKGLTSITCEAVTPPSCGFGCFSGANNYIPVYVPEHSVSAYQSAEGWKYFYNIQAIGTVQNNVIIYMATAKLPETTDEWSGGLHTNAFNVAITSHEFANGIGTITFAGEVTTIGNWAFLNCYDLISVTIPNSVTTIGDAAFSWNSELTLITIPKSVTTIGEGAFAYCSGLTSIYVEAGNTHYCSVDGVLFNYAKDTLIQYPASNSRIEYIIPNSVTTIENNVFYRCSGLISVFIPNSVTTIGETAFQECGSLASIDVDAANTHYCSIDGVLFNYTEDTLIQYPVGNTRTEYTIPNLVTTIEYGAFAYCNSLTSVTIPNSVTMIEHQAFYGSGVINVEVAWTSEEQLPSMGWGAFESIANWAGPSAAILHVPTGTKSIYQAADVWKDFGTITDKQSDPKNCVITYTATEKLPEAPDEWSGGLHTNAFNVAIISHEFSNGIGTITFAGEVTTIGETAFYYCSYLTSIAIPNSVTTIGDHAFEGCSFTSVTIPNSVTTIGNSAFSTCFDLTSFNVDAANTHYCSVDGVLFNYAKDVLVQYPIGNTRTEYIIPNSVTTIRDEAFYWCEGLSSITIGHSVTTIGNRAFTNCYSLTSIDVDAANTHYCSVDGVLFNYAKDVLVQYPIGNTRTEYTIPNSVTTIGNSAFTNSKYLISITIPNSVTTIGESAFSGCSGLTSITIPASVITIGSTAFGNCSSLTSITIPNSVTTISSYAFFDCSGLTSVTIPNSVTMIEYLAFYRCSGLTSVTCYAVTPPECGYEVFEYISQDAKVYVLASSLSAYQSADVWKDLNLLPLGADETPIDGDEPIVTPTDDAVTITWGVTDGADTYTLTITTGGEVVCVLTFNAQGQLVNIAFAAPSHNGVRQAPAATLTAQGYQFTVTGLTPCTSYEYSVVATGAGGKTIAEHKGNFSTTGGGTPTSMDKVHGSHTTKHKVLRNGQLLIETNNATYTPMGQMVK